MFSASEYKQVNSTRVPESTGNVVAVCIVFIQSGFSPLHISGRTESSVFKLEVNYTKSKKRLHLSIYSTKLSGKGYKFRPIRSQETVLSRF